MRAAAGHVGVSEATPHGDATPEFMRPIGLKLWRGASGRNFVHTIFTLIGCPAIEHSSYLLVRRGPDGRRLVLEVGKTQSGIASQDLACIRRTGATLGANEVHVFDCGDNEAMITATLDLALALSTPGSQNPPA